MDLVPRVYDMYDYLTVQEIQKILRIGKNTAYDLCKSGEFPVLKIGNAYRVNRVEFEKWCEHSTYKEISCGKN